MQQFENFQPDSTTSGFQAGGRRGVWQTLHAWRKAFTVVLRFENGTLLIPSSPGSPWRSMDLDKNVLSFQMAELGQGHQELILLTPLREAGWVSSGMGQRASLSAPSPTFLTRIPLLHSVQNVKLGQVEATPWDWPLTDYICLDLIFSQHGDTGPHIFPLVISLTCPVFEKIP